MGLFMTNRAEYLISWFAVARIDAAMKPIESGSFTRTVVAAISMVFSLDGARVSQMWIYQVQAQVTDRRTSIVTGVFVQILVTPDLLHHVSA